MMRVMTRVRAEQVKVRELRQVGIESCAIMREGESEKQVLLCSSDCLFFHRWSQLALLHERFSFCYLFFMKKESIRSISRHAIFADIIVFINATERVCSSCLAFQTCYTGRL